MSHYPDQWSAWGVDPRNQRWYRQRRNAQGEYEFEYAEDGAEQAATPTDPRYTGSYDPATLQTQQYNQEQYGQTPTQQNYLYNYGTTTSSTTGYAHSTGQQSYGYNTQAGHHPDTSLGLSQYPQQAYPQGYGNQTAYEQQYEHPYNRNNEENHDPAVRYGQSAGGGSSRRDHKPIFKVPDQSILRTSSDPKDTEKLDPEFKRVKTDIKKFFKPGRVFAILWTEPTASAPSTLSEATGGANARKAYSVVRFEESVFTEIRRFIVIRPQGDHHSTCIPILTYGKRGTVNRPDAKQHAIAYMGANAPDPLPGEELDKHAIKIEPRRNEELHEASRINFSKVYTIEHNLKIKAIGSVPKEYFAWVKLYWEEAMGLQSA